MLKPHLLLTVLILMLVVGLGVHFANRQNGSWNGPWTTSNNSATPRRSVETKTAPSGNSYSTGGQYRDSHGGNGESNIPGHFDYYALVLSWSPSYCAEKGENDNAQCNRRDGRRYSFVLHGLWPQFEYGYPSSCRLPRRPFVPDNVIQSMLDIMPSRGLVIHEYRTHGTCSGLDPAQYFATAHRLFDGITIPQQFRNPSEKQFISPADIRQDFLRSNAQLQPEMIAVVCDGKGLKEVRICMSKNGQPRACGRNENQSKLCSTDRVFVPPAGSTARPDASDRQAIPAPANVDRQSPLPGPHMDYDYERHN